ncbi:MAG: hypothetical protein EZS26_001914 [Candidatus Ordinivivax streblomastigis]|uniref:Secretion system C-terminal sorting domain-containing protein n=1 Tax=Candidatus Ordinivivax streblomastigis TaxID=2540710 RepID=A0A5M8P0I0_9BACT|nr:MAG: hypothetical protein EZS26_001914 [Candidatus Ordinivivax streblomastigis]
MKKISLFVLVSIVSLIFTQNVSAKDIYLSTSGNDSNDGLTAATAVKTLLRINEIIGVEDVVHVKGIIKITDEVDFATKTEDGTQDPLNPEDGIYLYHRGYFFRNALKLAGITFLGEDSSKDGFSGENVASLFQFQGAYPVMFKNILFTKAVTHRAANGQYGSDASAIWTSGTELTFENCAFTLNDITRNDASPADPKEGWGNRGAITFNSGTGIFKNCEFTENLGEEGGALFINGGTITIEDCYFGYNNCAEVNNSKGGAIYTWVHGLDGPLDITIKRTTFEGNTAKKGGAIALLDKVSYVPTGTILNIDRCTFIGNQAVSDQGGAIVWDNFMGRSSSDVVTITNSLFYANNANTDGGAICVWNVQPGSELNMINCTMYGNFTNGNAGHGGGLDFMMGYETYLPQNLKKNIYNCIFDGNYATEGGSLFSYSDLSALYPIEEPDNFTLKNSFVGRSISILGKTGVDPEANKIDYYTSEEYDGGITAGFDDPDYYAANYYAIPLLEDAEARTYGNPQYLDDLNLYTDLVGKPRTIVAGKCAIGACEVTSTELDNEVVFETGISSPQLEQASAKLSLVNGMLLCVGEKTTRIELYNLMGSKIADGKSYLSVNNVTSGVYIAKIQIGTNVFTQKLIINGN